MKVIYMVELNDYEISTVDGASGENAEHLAAGILLGSAVGFLMGGPVGAVAGAMSGGGHALILSIAFGY